MNRKYGPVMGAIMGRRLGSDLYFVLFGIFGMFIIPTFFFIRTQKSRKNREELDKKYGIHKDMDLDDRSLRFSPNDTAALRTEILKKEKKGQQIKKLRESLFEN